MPRKNIYNPNSKEPFKLSRTKIDLFMDCPRCFYFDQRHGFKRPSGPAFSLNIAVDDLLKKEFDIHRAKNKQHPLQKKYGLNAVPVAHDELDKWRHNFTGVQYLHEPTNLFIYGAIDDLWLDSKTMEYIIIDYKATAKKGAINTLDDVYFAHGYKRQMEIYQWIIRQNGHKVAKTGYLLYCNGIKDKEAFDAQLEFNLTLVPIEGDDSWIEDTLYEIKKTLNKRKPPKINNECEHCEYHNSIHSVDV